MNTKRNLLVVLSIIGLIFMVYLTYLHFAPDATSFCEINEEFSCEAVNKSIYSNLFGIPVAIGGMFFFAFVLFLAFQTKKKPEFFEHIAAVSILMIIPSLYMSGVSKFIIGKYCLYCELSKLIMALIILLTLSIPRVRKNAKYLLIAVVAGVLFAGAAYYNHSSLIPSGKYHTFAQCLTENGVLVYGSEGCAHCAKQRAMFGDSFEFITEIECDPRYEGAQTELCLERNIEGTPTWMQEDTEGNVLKRLSPGEKPLEELALFGDCELVEDN